MTRGFCLASDPAIAPGTYPGVWGTLGDQLAEYRFQSLTQGTWSGEIDLSTGRKGAPVPFSMERTESGTWTISWERSALGAGRQIPLREVETPHGRALIGDFGVNYRVGGTWALVLIYLNPDLPANPAGLEGQPPKIVEEGAGHYRVWTSEDGLVSNVTRVGLQTSDGLIWIGTTGGLSRFDGHGRGTLPHRARHARRDRQQPRANPLAG
ncbi:MAG: hypothetical protein H7A46_00900 [Verrucomicrobiales bacterium]|nr:hypothetical protein [Verrucomicrobiales bacterium]